MWIVESLVLGSLAFALVLLWRGPTPWDRLIAYNTASNRIVIAICLVAVATGETIYLDVAVGYAALSFLGVVIISRFLERGGGHR
ncbi:cation:proton antiporter [Candidatus Bipolaricaulota bacterium]|nr:cation:proton antiporter [Candidatus Bipolaricaulota bacterium]TFH06916.1 MAG: cation:proton antiporter [Candidatus Atribacteria bacterium]